MKQLPPLLPCSFWPTSCGEDSGLPPKGAQGHELFSFVVTASLVQGKHSLALLRRAAVMYFVVNDSGKVQRENLVQMRI